VREFARIERIIKALDLLWSQPQCADMRLGQLLINVAAMRHDEEDDLWYVEDEEWERRIDAFRERYCR
jgi:hypothetical protein